MNIIKRVFLRLLSRGALPYWCILMVDCLIVFVSGLAVYYLQFGFQMLIDHFSRVSVGLIVSLLVFLLSFFAFHTYKGILRYSSFVDLNRLAYSVATSCAIVCLLHQMQVHDIFVPDLYFPRFKGAVLIFILATSTMWALRVFVKTFHDSLRNIVHAKKVFIYGCQTGGIALAKSVLNSVDETYRIAGFVSEDPTFEGTRLLGIPVYYDNEDLVQHMIEKKVSVLFVSPIKSLHFTNRSSLIDRLLAARIKIMMIPQAQEWDGKSELTHQLLREVEIEDLLPREKIEIDMEAIGKMLRDKCILITGAAGSIGSEIARQVALFRPSHLILIDQAETPMHDVRLFMAQSHRDLHVETIVTSICNQEHMEKIFAQYRPEYVFHAAAYKHVPMMEDNPAEAVQNNVYGTRVIADLAAKYGTRKFVMISTDKAVNPTNVMGCSKRICEIYCQSLNNKLWKETQLTGRRTTQYVTTRFGNVLGSNGSVIPIFKEQIRKGGPVTVTHPDIIRYFMLIPEACRLVLQAGTMGHGGEIYVFDMGKPVRIADLAQRMIDLSGAKNIKILYTGLRDGEKLYEELLASKENTIPTPHPNIMVA
ncbi:MAG: nucleoside-diphosphate sugar epimerase/dehydratase, partial [Bacteroidaceae bacterium]|nr:nucleoside-diphosphate sugar epimerase/dehydratase [Bacteroidaceae bacterium]